MTPHYLELELMQVNRWVTGAAGYWLIADLWSLGIFLYYAFLGRVPFAHEGDLPADIYNAILYDHSPPDCSEICEIGQPRRTCRTFAISLPGKGRHCKDFSGLAFSMACRGACCSVTCNEAFLYCLTAVWKGQNARKTSWPTRRSGN